MKKGAKILTLLLTLVMLFSILAVVAIPASAATMTGGETLYLVPSSNWNQSNARFAIYLCNGSSSATWVSMTKVGNQNLYMAKVPSGNYKNVIFVRMNPNNATNSWDTKWNQTADLTYDGTKNCYTVKEGTWDKGGGTWSTATFTAVGSSASSDSDGALFGTGWDPANTANDLVKQSDGTYKKVYTGVPAGNYKMKVAFNHAWASAWPSANKDFSVAHSNSTVTIVFNPANGSITITSACEHTNKTTVTTNATCTTPGSTVEKCSACSTVINTTEIPASGHSWVDATCTAPKTCSACHITEGEALGHNYVNDYCTNCGGRDPDACVHEYTYDCDKNCNKCFEETRPDADHSVTHVEANAASCTENGNIEYWYCSICGSAWSNEALTEVTNQMSVVIPAGHTWVAADCDTPKTCSVCQATEGEALGHTWVDANCVTPKTCSVCQATEGEALGHTYTNGYCTCGDFDLTNTVTIYFENNWLWTDVKVYYWYGDANNSWPGVKCEVVGKLNGHDLYSIIVPKYADGFVINGVKNDGTGNRDKTPDIKTNIENCVCYKMEWKNNANNVVASTYHDNEIVTNDSTCTEAGSKVTTCKVCAASSTETIPVKAHDLVIENAVAPSCTETGLTAGEYCKNCDYKVAQEVVDALGHTEETIPAVDATCTETGLTVGVKCSVCGEVLDAQEVVPTIAHTYNAVVTAPTCTEAGYTTYTCSCGASYTADEVAALGHSYNTVVTDPTFEAEGYTTYTCSVCGYSYVDNYVSALVAVAEANGTKYESLADAIAAGGEVKLLANVTISSTIKVLAGNTVVLDLNGKVIDGIGNVRIALMSYGNLTIKDSSEAKDGVVKAGIGTAGNAVNICGGTFTLESGSIYSLNNALLIDEEACTVTIKGGNITAEPTTNNSAVFYVSSSSNTVINIEDGEMVGYNGILLWNNTEINITGGSIDAQGRIGIQGNGSKDNTKISISGDASVYGAVAGIYHPQGGELNISGNATIIGGTGIVVKGGNVTISGGTIKGEGEAKAYAPVNSGFESTGDALYVEHYDNSTNSENYGTPVVSVIGGSFLSTNGKSVASYENYNNNAVEALESFITGGTFNTPVENELCDNGFVVTENEDGSYGVVYNPAFGKACIIDGVYYDTLADAIAAAQNGNTITLLDNVTNSANITIAGKNITIDLAGYVISGVCNGNQASLIYVENNAELTVKDSVGTGKITYAQGTSNVGWTIDVKGKFVLESGTIELTGSWSIGYAVDVRPNSWGAEYTNPTIFVMNGGSIISSDGAVRIASSSVSSHKNVSASFVMNGGYIDAAWDGVFVQQSDAVYDDLSFTINGGTIESDLNPVRVYGPAPTSYVNDISCMNITLAGGTMTYTGTQTYEWIIEGILRAGGGSSVATIVDNGSIAISASIAESATAPEGYAWVVGENGLAVLEAASVAEVNGVGYVTLAEALEAAKNGGVVTLVDNIELNETIVISSGWNITIDLNGYSITRTVSETVSENTYLILNDGILTIKGEGKVELTYGGERVSRSISTICNRGTLNIVGGTINNNAGANNIAYAIDNNSTISNAVINISGGSVTGGASSYCIRLFLNSTVYANELNMNGGFAQYIWAQNPNTYANKGSISLTDDAYVWYVYVSAVEGECNAESITLNVEEGTSYYAPSCGTLKEGHELRIVDGVYVIVAVNYVAEIGGTKYESLQEAITAAQNGDTITLLADVNGDVTISAKQITLDLNGKKISAEGTDAVSVNNGATVTIKNGTLESNGYNCGGIYIKNATATLEDCTFIGTNSDMSCGVYASNGANVTINNCELVAHQYALIMMGANVTINGGKFEAETSVGANGSDDYDDATLTINDGIFNGAIYWPANGKLTINGGTFTANTAVYLKSGSLEITGGTFTGNGQASDYKYTLSGWKSTGAAIVIENVGADDYDAVTSVSITGGAFISVNASAIQSVSAGKDNVEALDSFIAGGTFNTDVNDLCAEGFMTKANEDGTFGIIAHTHSYSAVVTAPTFEAQGYTTYICACGDSYVADYVPALVAVAQIGDAKYVSVQAALDAAQAGDTVVLVSDVSLAQTITLDGTQYNVTLDLAGYTITAGFEANIVEVLLVKNGAKLTITGNGSMVANGEGEHVEVISVIDGATVTIKNGTFVSEGCTAIYATRGGSVSIEGGLYEAKALYNGMKFLLDINEAEETLGVITVSGGSFVGFNPANHNNDGANSNKLVAGYHAILADGVYNVGAHEYANGTCVCGKGAIVIGNASYATLAEAIAAAQNGDVIVLDTDASYSGVVYLANDVTVDLNGKTLTADGVVFFSANGGIIDKTHKGLLNIPHGRIIVNQGSESNMIPAWNEDGTGYSILEVKDQFKAPVTLSDSSFYVNFKPGINGAKEEGAKFFADGGLDNDLSFVIVVNFIKDGKVAQTLELKISEELVGSVYANNTSFKVTFTGASTAYDSYEVVSVIRSTTGYIHSVTIANFAPAKSSDEE